jgi:hypothetical protein
MKISCKIPDGIVIIDSSARILIDLISASFELNDQMSIKSLKSNAELIDELKDDGHSCLEFG